MNRQASSTMTSSKDVKLAAILRISTLIVLGFAAMVITSSAASAQVVISQIVPSSGPIKGGNVIRLLGKGFTTNTSVWLWANQAGASRLVSANELDVVAPRSTALGSVDVVATNTETDSYRASNGYSYVKATLPPTPGHPVTPTLSESASSLQFGNVTLGKTVTQSLTLKSSGTAPVIISSFSMSGAGYSIIGGSVGGVALSGVTLPVSLNPGVTATVTIQFSPANSGAAAGNFAVSSDSSTGSNLSASLAGTGVAVVTTPHLTITPGSLSLGSVTVGQTASQTITLTSAGNAPVVVKSAALAGAGYSISGMGLPATLAVGQKASLTVQFKPGNAGAVAGKIVLASNDPAGPAVVTLSATGVAQSAQGTPLNGCGDLTTSGAYYLTQDVSSSASCFFIDADNISLNLNGHTISYASAGGNKATPAVVLTDPWYTGVAKPGSTYAHGNFEIYGGSIIESKSGAPRSSTIWIGQSGDIAAPKVHDLTLTTYTTDASPIIGDISDSGWQIYNNKIYYSSTTTSSRYAFYGDAIWIGNQEQAPGPYTDLIYNNFIYAAPQGGIRDTHQNARIYSNDIAFNSLYTNDFCVDSPADGQQIYSNVCHPTSGRGIHTNANNVWVHDNAITVKELKQNAEYGGCELGGAYGVQVEFDNSFTSASPTGVQVANNQIQAIAGDCDAIGMRLTSMSSTGSVTYTSNSVNTTNAGGSGLDYGFSFSADEEGPNRFLFINNTFQSQHAYVTVDWDGANVVLPAGQTWKGSPAFVIDNENGYLDQADSGPTFQQGVTLGDEVPGAVFCGPYAAGVNMVGTANHKCN